MLEGLCRQITQQQPAPGQAVEHWHVVQFAINTSGSLQKTESFRGQNASAKRSQVAHPEPVPLRKNTAHQASRLPFGLRDNFAVTQRRARRIPQRNATLFVSAM